MAASARFFSRASFSLFSRANCQVTGSTLLVTAIRRFSSAGSKAASTSTAHRIASILGLSASFAGVYFYYITCPAKAHWKNPQAEVFIEREQTSNQLERVEQVPKLGKVTLYQYQTCPFCCKVRTFLDYYGIDYEIVEVNPLMRRELSFSKYKKVPIVVIGDLQLNDSSVIISALRTYLLGHDSLQQIATYYPEMTSKDSSGKETTEYVNRHRVMYKHPADKRTQEKIKEEVRWRKWVDSVFVHMLSPNIYRTTGEAMQAFEYFAKVGNFGTLERYAVQYGGAVGMYFIGKHIKSKYNLKDDVRASMYEEAEKWMKAVGKRKFMGGQAPNLADLAMYGVLSGLEGLDMHNDLLTHTSIKPWYNRVKEAVHSHAGALGAQKKH